MNSKIAVFIVTHEDLATALLQTVEKIMGKQENVYTYSNSHDSLPLLAEKISEKIQNVQFDHHVAFVDLIGGSCWTLGNILSKKHSNLVVVSGVNLPMLISFFTNKDNLTFIQLIEKIVADGIRGIVRLQGNS